MIKDKSRKHPPRALSDTPQKTNTRADNTDQNMTDPWAHQARMAKRALSAAAGSNSKPTPLSPAFAGKSPNEKDSASRPGNTISVPQDPNIDPSLIFQRMNHVRNAANPRPTYFGAVRLNDANGREDTPTPGQETVKNKKKKKSKEGDKGNRIKLLDEAGEAERKEHKKKFKAQMEQQTTRAIQDIKAGKKQPQSQAGLAYQTLIAAANETRKRKREVDDGEAFQRRVEVEANAVKKLRETLPAFSLHRVSRALEREDGILPTEMAVLLTVARDMILDLAKAQLFQTQQISSDVHEGMMRMIGAQEKRLKKLERNSIETEPSSTNVTEPLPTVAETLDHDTSSSGSDSDSDSDSEEEEEDTEVAELPKLDIPASGSERARKSYCHPQ